jgi:parallel beta-helix repeat protein
VREVTWLDLGVPYAIEGYVDVERVWTLSPGVTLVMREDAKIYVAGDDAAFRAVGTAAQPITITGAEPRPGSWRDIVFDFATNDANVLDYCVVEYGGGGAESGVYGMITADSDSRGVSLSVTNSTIRHSAVYGIWLGATWSGTLEGNTMSGNALGDVFHDE